MLADRTGISIAKSETGQADVITWLPFATAVVSQSHRYSQPTEG